MTVAKIVLRLCALSVLLLGLATRPLQGQTSIDSLIVTSTCYDYANTTAALADAYLVLLKITSSDDRAQHLSAAKDRYEAEISNAMSITYVPDRLSSDLLTEGDDDLRSIRSMIEQKHLNETQKKSLVRIARNVYIAILKDQDAIRINRSLQQQHRTSSTVVSARASEAITERGPRQLAMATFLQQVLNAVMRNNEMPMAQLSKLTAADGMQWGPECHFVLGQGPEPCDGDLRDK